MPRRLVDNPKALPIVDATEDVLVKVTPADVRKAKKMSPTDCAIALGCRRSMKDVVQATINKSVSYLTFKDKILRYTTPQAAAREIVAIDRGGAFAPGDYWLKAPTKHNSLGRKQNGRKRTSEDGSRGPFRNPRHVTVMVRGA